MRSSPLRLRNDLIVRLHQTAYGTSAVIKHPVSGKFFRLGETELFITQQLDGKTPVEVIRRRTEARFDGVLPIETLNAFLLNLKKNDVLEAPDAKRKDENKGQSRFRGSPLVCRIKLCDPCQLFNRLVRRVGFFFTPYFVVLSAAAILSAVGVTAASWSEFRENLPRLYQPSAIPAVIFILFVVIVAHEFGHGMTCTHFGGEVHEMGFVLILLQPAFYCNVSDAWLFPERSRRLWVGFAGPYFELFLWALAVFTWRMTEADTWVNFAALSVMATSGIKTLLNFNPLIKLDGYYLLSDYLEIPNLRRRSFRYVGRLIEKVFGVESAAEPDEDLSPRERRIFPVYGIAALAGSFSILGYILVSAGGSLVEGRTPTAFLLSLGLLGMKFRRRFRRMFAKSSTTSASFDDEDFDVPDGASHTDQVALPEAVEHIVPPEEAGSSDLLAVPKNGDHLDTPKEAGKPARSAARKEHVSRRLKRWGRRIVWATLAAATVASLFHFQRELRIGGPLNILPVRNADVRTEIDGRIAEILVTEGAIVHKGDLIAVLSTRENRSELEKTQGLIQQSDAKLRLQIAGPTADEIEVAKTAVVKAKDNFKYAGTKLAATKELFANSLASRIEMETAEQLYATAKDDLDDAQGKLKVLQNGTRPEEVDQTKAEIAGLEAQQRFLHGQIARAEIRSPVDGVVATPELELKEMAGQVVQKGALIAKVFELRKLTVEIAVPEGEIADVKVGQEVALKVRAYPNQTFNGRVISVATSALSENSAPEAGSVIPARHPSSAAAAAARTILVTTELDNGSLLLKPGMTGHAKIACGQRRMIDIITRRLARTVKVEFWSWQ
jgi:putative peptide zinc metalloprotease protein